jgi:hypothetical protein
MRLRPARRAAVVAIACAVALGGIGSLGGCSLARNVVEGASGGSVDIGGKGLPKGFPQDAVPLAEGDVVYGAGLKTDEGQGWNVTVAVAGLDAFEPIVTQLTGAGYAQSTSGRDDTGATGTFAKEPYTVRVLVTKDASDGWTATYTVTRTESTATPTPSPTAG